MTSKLKARICQDALIAPASLFLKVDLPDGSQLVGGVTPCTIAEFCELVREEFGIDLMPLVLAEIERHHTSDHPGKLTMPAELVELITGYRTGLNAGVVATTNKSRVATGYHRQSIQAAE